MFVESAELYDAIYHFKNYARECEILRAVIAVAAPGARTVLDVACGTGGHDKFLKEHYTIDGIDINEPENNLIGYNLAPDALQEIKYSIDVAAHDMATPSSLETNINFHCHHLPRSNRDKRSTLGVLSGTGCRRH